MNIIDKEKIYDRLLGMRLEIEFEKIPNPDYINNKIGLCHVFLEEIEGYNIRVNKEISLTQRALNDSVAHYEVLKQDLISSNVDIKDLPNIKDREARADSFLKDNLDTIRKHKNELSDLKSILKVIDLKIKNLYRVNNDIKIQLRLMESQIKLNAFDRTNASTQDLMEELAKGKMNKDIFEGVDTEEEKEKITDPSDPQNIQNLVNSEPVDGSLIDPSPALSPEILESVNKARQSSESTPEPSTKSKVSVDVKSEEQAIVSQIPDEADEVSSEESNQDIFGDLKPTEEMIKEVDKSISSQEEVDINQLLKGDEDPKSRDKIKDSSKKTEIDIESLLRTFV